VALRWIHEQGVTCIVKSYSKERLRQNLGIFDWELTDEERLKISQIPQRKVVQTSSLFSQEGEFTAVDPAELNILEE
jgi:3''-deamino-3''-oxonicotianamine reductase